MQEALPEVRFPEIFCPAKNEAKMICVSQQCKYFSFMCIQINCQQCFKLHSGCKSYWLKSFNEKILRKRKIIPPVVEQSLNKMNEIYDKAIQKLEQDRNRLTDQIQLYGLNENEAKFINLLKKSQFTAINGSLLSSIMHNLDQKFQFHECQQAIRRYWNRKQKDFTNIFAHFKKIWQKPPSKFPSILTNELQLLQGFFQKRNVIEFELLYRASEHDFSANKFHELCDGYSDTLVIAKTQFGRIIGGYSPNKWSTVSNYCNDTDGKTFLFSISNRQKYNIIQQAQAIYCYPNYGPTFGGGHDFYICDNANTVNSSYFNFGYSFNTNGKCQVDTQEAYTFFCGSPNGYNSMITQYEVFQVFFSD